MNGKNDFEPPGFQNISRGFQTKFYPDVTKQTFIEEKTDAHHRRRLDISLTGFQGTEKAVIVNIIGAIGGLYHGNMSNVNTHLVFKKNATGLKLEKAIEWGLHVVSIQWLYHILEHGYGGVDDDELGCEKKFSLVGS